MRKGSVRGRARLTSVLLALAGLGLAACSSAGSSGHATGAGSTGQKTYSSTASLVAAAKKEGTVRVYMSPELTPFLVPRFKKAYPWATVNVTGLEADDASAKWATELSAGIHNVDVVFTYVTQVKEFTSQGGVAAVKLPNDSLIEKPLQDPQHHYHTVVSYPYVLLYNTKELKGGPPQLTDLTQPQWKGKVVLDNPSLGGPGGLVLASLKNQLGSRWQDWLQKFQANSPSLTDSSSTSYDAVVRGDRPLCICSYHDYIAQPPGTPVNVDFYNQSGSGVVPQAGVMQIAAQAPHAAMAALWVNWLLSPHGGQAGIASSGRTPVVANVPGAAKVSVPAGVKVAPFSVLGSYLADPNSFNSTFKSIFGS